MDLPRKRDVFIELSEVSLLQIKNLQKKYSQGFHLHAEDCTIGTDQLVAFLGANGSGKTTLFEILSGNSDVSQGSVHWKGQRMLPDHAELKRQFGYLPQNMHLPKWVTGQELLTYASLLYGIKAHKDVVMRSMEYWDCASYKDKPLASCSYGMQKRIGLALSTLHDPDCLILDEPFSGLDILHIHSLEEALRRRQAQGKLTILSTHIIPYVVQSCGRVFILEDGKVFEIKTWAQQSYEERTKGIEDHFFHKGRRSTHVVEGPTTDR